MSKLITVVFCLLAVGFVSGLRMHARRVPFNLTISQDPSEKGASHAGNNNNLTEYAHARSSSHARNNNNLTEYAHARSSRNYTRPGHAKEGEIHARSSRNYTRPGHAKEGEIHEANHLVNLTLL